ncbi:MAG: hypothetical protein ACQES9_03825 [Myxococcota bacterium]
MKLFLLPILLLVFSCSENTESSPQKVADTFVISVLNDLNGEQIKNLSKDSKGKLEKAAKQWQKKGLEIEPSDLLVSIPQSNEDWLGSLDTKIISTEKNKKTVEITSDYNKKKKLQLQLIKEHDSWKIELF